MNLRRVVGPPGTGKTTFLAREAKQSAEHYGNNGVLICSLTRAAAAEVGGRETGIVGQNVGTLHSHAYRALRTNGFATNSMIADSPKGIAAWNLIAPREFRMTEQAKLNDVDDLYGDNIGGDLVADAILSDYTILRQQMVPQEAWPDNIRKFHDAWGAFKIETDMIDFTDMIELCLNAKIMPRREISVIYADEAQDLSRLEYSLVRMWGESAQQVTIVGDPDQNLYQWRGSDPEAFYEHEAADFRVLNQSYRVPREVHAGAVRLIEQTPHRKPISYLPRAENGKLIREYIGTWVEPNLLPEILLEHAQAGETAMVLASCKFMLVRMISRLREAGIPFHNPYRKKDGQWNPLGITKMPARVLALLRPQPSVWGEEARMWNARDVKLFASEFKAEAFTKRGLKTWVREIHDGDTRNFSIEALLKIFPEQVLVGLMDGDLTFWQSLLVGEQHRVSDFTCRVALRQGAATLRDDPKIIVGTIHSVKGGEADHVYLWPDVSSAAAQHFELRSPDAATIRTFYVGMTRARHQLHLLPPVPRGYHVEL